MAFSMSLKKGQVPVKCKLCETDRPIQCKCMDCSILMCVHCKNKVHSQFKNAQDHKIISIEEIGQHREELDFTNIKCHEHTGQSSCLYCNTCEMLVCPTCIAKVHKKHDLIEINDAYNKKVKRLNKELGKMQKSNQNMNAAKGKLNKLMSVENSKYSKARLTFLIHEKNVKERVEKYFKELKSKLSQSHETVLTIFTSDLNSISLFANKIEERINQVQDSIAISNATDFFAHIKTLEKFTSIKEPQTKFSYSSSLRFVPGSFNQSHIGYFQDDGVLEVEKDISLEIESEYQTNFPIIAFISTCTDHSIWLSASQYKLLQRVKPEGNNLNVISTFNIKVCGMVVTPSHQLLLCIEGKSRLQQISSTGELTDSVYDVTPFLPSAIHVVSENKLIVGAYNDHLCKSAVIIMNEKGNKETMYEHDEHNRPLFAYPKRITTTSNGHIHVVDKISGDLSGKLLVISPDGHIANEYTGHSAINKSKSFKPVNIVTSPNDNVVVIDKATHILHILNNNGHLVSYFNTNDIGILFPWSLGFNTTGQLYIGCTKTADSQIMEAKLYVIDIVGF